MLHCKQAINLKQDHSLSCRATGTLTQRMKNRYRSFLFLHCICLLLLSVCYLHLILIKHHPHPAFMRSFEFDTVFHPALWQCNRGIPLPEIAPWLLTPFVAAPQPRHRIDAVVPMLWHFKGKIDVQRSIRQHTDIYIRKNGCCWAREERKMVGEGSWHGGYHPVLTDTPWQSLWPSCCCTKMVCEIFFYTTCNSHHQGIKGMTYANAPQTALVGG